MCLSSEEAWETQIWEGNPCNSEENMGDGEKAVKHP